MKIFLTIILSVTLLFGSANLLAAAGESTVIRNATLISTISMEVQPGVDVLIVGGKIAQIGKDLMVSASREIDASGRFLIPGLIDAHTHLSGVPGMSYEQAQNNSDVAAQAYRQIPLSYLYHGFTTVIDLHSNAESIAAWNAQALRPTAYFCGAAPLLDGYPTNFMPASIRAQVTPYYLLGDRPLPKSSEPANHSPQAVVQRMVGDGAICVKTHFETGFGSVKNLPTPTVELIQELVANAHQQGLKVLLHANSQSAQQFGIAAGVDAFVHGLWTWDDAHASAINDPVAALIDDAVAAGIVLQPTIQVLMGERDLHDPDYLNHNSIQHAVPASLVKWYDSPDGQTFRMQMREVPYVQRLLAESGWQQINAAPLKRVTAATKQWVKQGGKLFFGSDTPSDMTYANPPGLNGRMEMQQWHAMGIGLEQLLASATIENAKFFGLAKELGSIDVGKRADMLLLSKNPLLTISAYDSIDWVMIGGRINAREKLSALSE
ncbi:amidohydrolase family protein [Arenicella xantha]|uniref:Imidazolonepropionase-like amidohydrolase n=1 Tax=Arenicella xantha TaxID=644221 RepID=A0A395JT09_9GAMM|nr:amidohydrolase family protein [Arenicella xantha]RBP53472.1 imidazolonepropionase-like amidohydrolase [Arenicella xantha]